MLIRKDTCRKCGETKAQDLFQKDKSMPNGYRRVCKECKNTAVMSDEEKRSRRATYLRQWKKENPSYEQEWKLVNKDKVQANARSWYHKSYGKDIVRWMLIRAKRRALASSVPFTLTEADITIPEICPALGVPLVVAKGRTSPSSPSLDRIEPLLGYVPGNVIVVSMLANSIKTNATPQQILAVGSFYANLQRQKSSPAETA